MEGNSALWVSLTNCAHVKDPGTGVLGSMGRAGTGGSSGVGLGVLLRWCVAVGVRAVGRWHGRWRRLATVAASAREHNYDPAQQRDDYSRDPQTDYQRDGDSRSDLAARRVCTRAAGSEGEVEVALRVVAVGGDRGCLIGCRDAPPQKRGLVDCPTMSAVIDFEAATPVYLQLAGLLRDGIDAGTYPAGRVLPSVRTLVEECGVSDGTGAKGSARAQSRGIDRDCARSRDVRKERKGTFIVRSEDDLAKAPVAALPRPERTVPPLWAGIAPRKLACWAGQIGLICTARLAPEAVRIHPHAELVRSRSTW